MAKGDKYRCTWPPITFARSRASTVFRSKCCIRIYEPEDESDAPMVICSELADNPGTNNQRRRASLSVPVWIELC